MFKRLIAILVLFSAGISGCENEEQSAETDSRPNILWLVAEDLSPDYLPMYGDSTVRTLNLSGLAEDGVVYTNFFSPSGVCAPSRASIITGMYPSGIGANHMRTNSYTEVTGLPAYEAVPPPDVRMFTEYLRQAGYYTTNNSKQDYQFNAPVTAWDENGNYAHWRNREDLDQPFFSVFNFNVTHESGLFEPYGIREMELRHYNSGNRNVEIAPWNEKTDPSETPVHVSMNQWFDAPPYLPDTRTTQRDLWKVYNNIGEMDDQLGAIIRQLREDGELENTIIFFYGDHGGPLPRQKRLIYDSGLHAPLIIRFPDKMNAGTKDEQLISFIDLAPTILSLAGIEPPEYMQGQAFLGEYKSEKERRYVHAAVDRLDGYTDAIRAVRDKQFKYIRNYHPELPYYQPIEYREQIPSMQELLRLNDLGELNEIQSQWFRQSKPEEELFDLESDPFELHNLAGDTNVRSRLTELQKEMDRWLNEIGDDPKRSEVDLILELWDHTETQPVTSTPMISYSDSKVSISSETEGASIGYRIRSKETKPSHSWQIYSEAFEVSRNDTLEILAHRIGYVPSSPVTFIPQNNE